MKYLDKFSNKLQKLYEELDDVIGEIEQSMDALEEHAGEMDRDMTEAEQDKWDTYEAEISDIRECLDNIESAQFCIAEYCREDN